MTTALPTASNFRRSTRARKAFRPATIVGLLAVGAVAFVVLLYALGTGLTGQQDRNGGAHAGSNSINGFAGLAQLLEATGRNVTLSRSPAAYDDPGLLVITPSQFGDGEEIWETVIERRYIGPTLLVMPKWNAIPIPEDAEVDAEEGWIILGATSPPYWLEDAEGLAEAEILHGETQGWSGLGLSGTLAAPEQTQALVEETAVRILPIVTDSEGDVLAGVREDDGFYSVLYERAGIPYSQDNVYDHDQSSWPVVIVFEPDLLNNYGLADETRARLALALVDATMDGEDLSVTFDLALAGLGSTQNLLTLAFTPPFLAATLTLLLIALVIAWRGVRRFGAARAEAPAMAHGKTQLAANGARLLQRAKRWHLLGAPYADMVAARIAATLGIRSRDPSERAAAIDRVLLAETGQARFAETAAALRNAERPQDILRAARDLRDIERTLHR